jgi:hypothetical protein
LAVVVLKIQTVLILYFLVSRQLVVGKVLVQIRQVLVVQVVVEDTTALLVEQHPHLGKDLRVVLVVLVLVALAQVTATHQGVEAVLVPSAGMALVQNLVTVAQV